MASWLFSPWWSVAYFLGSLATMGWAYYSRTESVQRLALYVFCANVVSHIVVGTHWQLPTYLAIDMVGVYYAGKLLAENPADNVSRWIMYLFLAMVVLHLWYAEPWHPFALNALFVAQLLALSTYGKTYGDQARMAGPNSRNDLYYRMAIACRVLKT